jgi:hypothetical protein
MGLTFVKILFEKKYIYGRREKSRFHDSPVSGRSDRPSGGGHIDWTESVLFSKGVCFLF